MEYQWSHTAHLLAMLVNVNRGPDSPVAHPRDFNPMLPKREPKKIPLSYLKDIWGKKK